jgi:hypothetical protein
MNPLTSKLTIHSDGRSQTNVVGATPTSDRRAVKISQREPVQIAKDMKAEMSSIRELYESKKKNAPETVPLRTLTK